MVSNGRRILAASGLLVLALVAGACGGATSAGSGTGPGPTTSEGAAFTPTGASSVAPSPAASPAPALKLLWERAGTTPPHGDDPDTYWPAIDPLTGDIWVALSFNDLYWIFKPDGTYLGSFGGPGTGPGQFNFNRPCPCGAGAIAFAPDGSFFVADDGNNRIQKFDASHHFVKAWGSFGSGDGQFADANVIVTDGKAVYVYDDQRTDIQVFDTDGRFLRKTGTTCGWLAVDTSGHLYTCSDAGIVEYDTTGSQIHEYALPTFDAWRIDLALDRAGRLYFNLLDPVLPNSALGLVRYDPATGSVTRWSSGGESLAVDPSGGAVYEANFVGLGWPTAVLRKYALPAAP